MLYLLALAVGFVVGFVIGALSGVLSVSDGEEIVRLRDAGHQEVVRSLLELRDSREEVRQLKAEIERLRGLLKKALTYSHSMPTTLVAAIEKEVSDECGSRIVHGNPRGVNR